MTRLDQRNRHDSNAISGLRPPGDSRRPCGRDARAVRSRRGRTGWPAMSVVDRDDRAPQPWGWELPAGGVAVLGPGRGDAGPGRAGRGVVPGRAGLVLAHPGRVVPRGGRVVLRAPGPRSHRGSGGRAACHLGRVHGDRPGRAGLDRGHRARGVGVAARVRRHQRLGDPPRRRRRPRRRPAAPPPRRDPPRPVPDQDRRKARA